MINNPIVYVTIYVEVSQQSNTFLDPLLRMERMYRTFLVNELRSIDHLGICNIQAYFQFDNLTLLLLNDL